MARTGWMYRHRSTDTSIQTVKQTQTSKHACQTSRQRDIQIDRHSKNGRSFDAHVDTNIGSINVLLPLAVTAC